MPAGEISAEEVYRNVEKLERRIEQGFKDIRIDINTMFMRFVSIDRYEPEIAAINKRLDEQSDSHKWLFRTVMSIVASALVGGVITAILIKAGIG